MFGKLLKYEFSASAKDLLPIYLLVIVAAIITNLFLLVDFNTPSVIAIVIFSGICVAAVVITLVTIIRRFRRNLLKDEGYLMFTLPVSTKQLILSKAVSATIWGIIGLLCGILSGLIFVVNLVPIDWNALGDGLSKILSWATAGDWLLLLEIFVALTLNYLIFLFAIYLSVSVGQLPLFKTRDVIRKRVIPILCFILFYLIYTGISNLISHVIPFEETVEITKSADLLLPVLEGIGIEFLAVTGVFFLINFILSRHLNLE